MEEQERIYIYDIETYKALFCYNAREVNSRKQVVFEISRRKNQVDSLVKHLREQMRFHVGYNNVSFDGQVCQFILDNHQKWADKTGEEICQIIYLFAQEVIDLANYELRPPYFESQILTPETDLMRIHHYDNEAKRCSLKWLEFSMDQNMEELPYDFRSPFLTDKQMDEVIDYCWNDVDATESLYNITRGNTENAVYKGKDKIQDRLDLMEEGLLKNCLNYSDVKLGDELNKLGYCKEAGIEVKEIYNLKRNRKPTPKFTFGQCIPKYVRFKTQKFQEFHKKVAKEVVKLRKETKEDEQQFLLTHNGTTYSIMRGGIHSTESNRAIFRQESYLLKDADVGSQYPNAINKRKLYPSHLGPKWNIQYNRNTVVRLEYKAKGESNVRYKGLAETFKLALNGGGFGKTNEPNSWQYDPFVQFSCTIGNEFEILMLIEMLEEEGIHCISANTDGIVCYFPKILEEKYMEICHEWEKIVGNEKQGKLEYADYEKLIQSSVNHYIAVDKKGKWKKKGSFVTDVELHKNKSRRIIPLALEAFFVDGTPIKETILNHKNIFDFCIGKKSSRDYYYRGITPDGKTTDYKKLIRYFVSNEGEVLFKMKHETSEKTGPKQSFCEKKEDGEWLCTVMNHLPPKEKKIEDFNINYQYYIDKTNEILYKLIPSQRQRDLEEGMGVLTLF